MECLQQTLHPVLFLCMVYFEAFIDTVPACCGKLYSVSVGLPSVP